MRLAATLALLCVTLCTGCEVEQPENFQTVEAFEVPLPTATERDEFLALLRREAEASGYHLDSAGAKELAALSEVSPMTINANIWDGKDDEQSIATIMDSDQHLGDAWIMFAKTENPERAKRFRASVMPKISKRWPATRSLPVVEGGIPNRVHLERTNEGYKVRPGYDPKS